MSRLLLLTTFAFLVLVSGACRSGRGPAPQAAPSRSGGATSVAAGEDHTCALLGGGVRCWGSNYYGQLGDGTSTSRATPVDVAGLSSGAAALSAGRYHTCALLLSGVVKCWGHSFGRLKDGSGRLGNEPEAVSGLPSRAVAVATGDGHNCALLADGGLKCWGDNVFGQLGDGTKTQRHEPVDVMGLTSGVTAVALGGTHTCALLTGGVVKCWGNNSDHQLGNGTNVSEKTPVTVSGLTSGVTAIAARGDHTCALLTDGGVRCWGRNDSSELGNGTSRAERTPVAVSGLTSGVIALAAGYAHTCALVAGGGTKCWGDDGSPEISLPPTAEEIDTCDGCDPELLAGSTRYKSTPVDVAGLSSGVVALAAGYRHTCAILDGGGLKCWGFNGSAQLGDGTTTPSTTPVDVRIEGPRRSR